MLVGIAGIEADLKDANLGGARLNEADLSVFRHGLPANYATDFAKRQGAVTLSEVWSRVASPEPTLVQSVAWGA